VSRWGRSYIPLPNSKFIQASFKKRCNKLVRSRRHSS
jgi:hypothetical protein